jgi:hypothetical protein
MKSSICRPGPVLWLAGYQISGDYCPTCKRPMHPAAGTSNMAKDIRASVERARAGVGHPTRFRSD